MRKNTKRTNRAFKIAYWTEVQRISWAVTLNAFCHTWAMLIVGLLIPSAITVLQFLAALNRAGKNGYLGCAVAYSLLAPRIAAATQRPCSVRTLERGLACLRILGLVRLDWWTIPDYHAQNGDHEVIVRGTSRVKTDDGWKRCQIRIITLTDRAIALWDRATGNQGYVHLPHYARFLTPAKMADSLQNDLVGKPTKIGTPVTDDDSPHDQSKSVFDYVSNTSLDNRAASRGEQGRSTRPKSPRAATETFEHIPSKNLPADTDQTELPDLPKKALKERLFSESESCDSTRDFTLPADTGKISTKPADHPKSGIGITTRGISHTPPKIPRSAKKKTTWPVARAYILAELAFGLRKYSRREADAIYERARYELSNDFPAGWPTSVDWPYWVGRFGNFTQNQRRYHIFRDIIPLLKARTAVPSEAHKFAIYTGEGQISTIGAELDPFLKKFVNRFCRTSADSED